MMGSEEYISRKGYKFSIDRIFNDKKFHFGVFDTYEEALEKLEYLEEEGWPIPKNKVEKEVVIDNLGLSLNNIEEVDGKFIIFKFINGNKVIFGEYDSIDEAKQIRNNLIDNAWESTEPNTRSKFGKYIIKDNNKFIVRRIYKGVSHTFGYFKTLDEAIKCREELVSKNWGDLNIELQMRPGKYISFNGIMYTIQRMVNGKLHVYGFFYELEDALKQRDWLIDNNWSRLEVPDDSKRFIHKQGDKFLIYKNDGDNLEYYGECSSLEEAKSLRNKLIMNDWKLEEDKGDIEKITDHVYFDGEFYIIRNEIDGQIRIYGIYKNKNQAISDENSFIKYDWDGVYSIPTEEYPYGENIVPFDYIFILENEDKKEVGRYYSFRDVVIAKNELNKREEIDKLVFSVKIGKSYKNRGWAIIRDSTYDLVPKLPYEDECDIIVDGIPTTARFNLLPRLFYNKTEEVINHLENLAKTNPEGRIDVELLLNKENPLQNSDDVDNIDLELDKLKKEVYKLKTDNDELKEILTYMDDENNSYLKKFDDLTKLIDGFEDIDIRVEELTHMSNSNLRIKILDIIDQFKAIKKTIKD